MLVLARGFSSSTKQEKRPPAPVAPTRRKDQMDAPTNLSIPDNPPALMILFRIISRRSWDDLQGWHKAIPVSHVEHLMVGLYVLIIEPGGAKGRVA
jgi:hypothetical protein